MLQLQDYHRFHFLTGATLTSITNVPGRLYTVNPIAINSPFVNVLTQNKRAICIYDTPEYGPVAFVVIGATMVGIAPLYLQQYCFRHPLTTIPSAHRWTTPPPPPPHPSLFLSMGPWPL